MKFKLSHSQLQRPAFHAHRAPCLPRAQWSMMSWYPGTVSTRKHHSHPLSAGQSLLYRHCSPRCSLSRFCARLWNMRLSDTDNNLFLIVFPLPSLLSRITVGVPNTNRSCKPLCLPRILFYKFKYILWLCLHFMNYILEHDCL